MPLWSLHAPPLNCPPSLKLLGHLSLSSRGNVKLSSAFAVAGCRFFKVLVRVWASVFLHLWVWARAYIGADRQRWQVWKCCRACVSDAEANSINGSVPRLQLFLNSLSEVCRRHRSWGRVIQQAFNTFQIQAWQPSIVRWSSQTAFLPSLRCF